MNFGIFNARALLDRRWIYIDVQEARSLRPADINGWSDPYCKITLGPKTKIGKTRYIERTLNPRWFQRFVWSGAINWEKDAYLRFVVCDYDTATSDDELGVFEIALSRLRDGLWESQWYRLCEPDKPEVEGSGYLHLRIHLVDDPSKAFMSEFQRNKEAKRRQTNAEQEPPPPPEAAPKPKRTRARPARK